VCTNFVDKQGEVQAAGYSKICISFGRNTKANPATAAGSLLYNEGLGRQHVGHPAVK
jgi:hypothetical protein